MSGGQWNQAGKTVKSEVTDATRTLSIPSTTECDQEGVHQERTGRHEQRHQDRARTFSVAFTAIIAGVKGGGCILICNEGYEVGLFSSCVNFSLSTIIHSHVA